ncbi:MAG TPA: hypothetical protein VM123_06270 [archaeon]|nr:hypothetical protein [archaeon]
MTDHIFDKHGLVLFKTYKVRATRRIKKINFSRQLTWAEYARVRKGFLPLTTMDKWLIYHRSGMLYFYRSGNGILVYKVRFANREQGFEAIEAWVNGDPEQLDPLPEDYEGRLLGYLIDRLLLNLEVPFPLPEGTDSEETALLERIWMGDCRAGPEAD